MNDNQDLKLVYFEMTFFKCNEKADVWKLGLCYLVAGLLMLSEANGALHEGLLSMVDNEDDFLSYPWGRHAYYKTLRGLNKNMVNYKEKYFGKIKEKKKSEAKYTVYGYHIALIYWAFEAIPMLGQQYAEYIGAKVPRMLSWTSSNVPMSQALADLFKQKNVSVPVLLLFIFVLHFLF